MNSRGQEELDGHLDTKCLFMISINILVQRANFGSFIRHFSDGDGRWFLLIWSNVDISRVKIDERYSIYSPAREWDGKVGTERESNSVFGSNR